MAAAQSDEAALELRKLNLSVLQRIDNQINNIFDSAKHSSVYKFDSTTNQWVPPPLNNFFCFSS